MMAVTDIMAEIVGKVSERYGRHVQFQFGDWDYIANVLQLMGTSSATSSKRYPVVCLRSPFTEERSGDSRTVRLELLIAVNTLQSYSNEQREKTSFAEVLRPLYDLLMDELSRSRHIATNYRGILPHQYTENYRYGRKGVEGGDGKPFRDFIDAIEIDNLELKIKNLKCYE